MSGQTRGWGRWALGLGVAAVLGLGLAGGADATTVRRVDSADGSCNASGPVYCEIQDAIDDSSAGDTVYVKFGNDGTYQGCIDVDRRINVVAGGDVAILGATCDVAVMISGSRARFQGFTVVDQQVLIGITGSDNVVTANRLHECGVGVLLGDGAARNLVVANVVNECNVGILVGASVLFTVSAVTASFVDGVPFAPAGPNNQLLHNVIANVPLSHTTPGILVSSSRTTLIGNAVTWNGGPGIDIQRLCGPKILGTALSKNVAAQNNQDGEPDYFDIRVDPRSQRPVLRGNIYQTSGVAQDLVECLLQ